MISKADIKHTISRAAVADIQENPSLFLEAARKGQDYLNDLLMTDALNALRGEPGTPLFPHMRGAIRDLVGRAKQVRWSIAGRYLGQFSPMMFSLDNGGSKDTTDTDTTDDKKKDEFNLATFLPNLISTIGGIGVDIWKSKELLDLKKEEVDLLKRAQAAQNTGGTLSPQQQQQLMALQARLEAERSGTPGWILPVAIGGGVLLIGAMFMMRR